MDKYERRQARQDRSSAIATGAFFIIATAFLIIGEAIYKPILGAPDFLERAADEKSRIVFGLLVEFLCVLAIPMIAVSINPVLKRVNESVAMAYVVFRSLEAAILIAVAQPNKFALIGLSERYIAHGRTNPEGYQSIARGFAAQNYWADTAGPI